MEERIIEWQQYGTTVIHPLGILFAVIMWGLVLFLKREYKVFPYLMIGCFMTSMQRIVVMGINFPYMRIAILIGMLIVLLSRQYQLKLNTIDKAIIAFIILKVILCGVLMGSSGVIEKLGQGCDTVLAYFFLRYIFSEIEDYTYIMKFFAIASIVIAIFMINEKLSGRNLFSFLGGVPEFTMEREGRLRAQAAIDHPILAGTFGALLIPFMWVLWNQKNKFHALAGAISGIIITFTSASSGPIMTLMSSFIGLLLWRFREKRKYFIWAIIIPVVVLQLVMNNPVWFIFMYIDFAGGSTGYFRSMLIDESIRHLPEWLLYGTRSSGQWAWGLQDTTNQYLREGFDGGLITLILFVTIIIMGFKYVGKSLDIFKDDSIKQKTAWALGTILFAHCVTFIGVSYFGHMEFFYFMHLAMISSLLAFKEEEGGAADPERALMPG